MSDNKSFGIRLEESPTLPAAAEQSAVAYDSAFCEVSGFGELEWLELMLDETTNTVQRFEGPLQLVQLNGRVRAAGPVVLSDFMCIVSRRTDNGIQLLGGKLHRALAAYLDLVLTPLTPIEEAGLDKSKAAPQATAGTAALQPPSAATLPAKPAYLKESAPTPSDREVNRAPAALDDRWAKAVLESKRQQDAPDFFDEDEEREIRPKRGDLVIHAQFGECLVTRMDDDHITLRKPNGRNIQLGLPVLRFVSIGERNGKKAFRVEIGKR